MNLTSKHTVSLVRNYIKLIKTSKSEIVICPSFTSIPPVFQVIKKSKLSLGSQDIFYEQKGAYTGQISSIMLKEYGCKYSIIGHSERRQYLKESDELVNLKLKAAINASISPILCIGESLEHRNNRESFTFIENQLRNCISDIDKNHVSKVVIAYEPIWAISTTANRKDITTEDISQMHNFIRNLLKDIYDMHTASKVRIIYGGSVSDQNIAEILKAEYIDGVLVGSASLDAKKFSKVVRGFEKR